VLIKTLFIKLIKSSKASS